MAYYSQNQFQNPIYPQPQMYQQPSYQQGYSAYAPSYQQSYQGTSAGINWVQGEIGAKAYPVAPGNSTLLMDSDEQMFYIKSADNTGMPSLRKFAYSEVANEQPKLETHSHDNSDDIDTAVHATREEVKQLHEEIREMREKMEGLEVENKSLRDQMMKSQNGGRKNG